MALHLDPGTRSVYEAAGRFREQCLASDGSLFSPGTPIWSQEVVSDLYDRFVQSPDTSTDTFDVKLERQLRGAAPATIQLAAETLYVHFLIAADIGGPAKRRLINRVLSWSSEPAAMPSDLEQVLEHGLAKTGVAFKTYRPHQLWLLIEFTRLWKIQTESDRKHLLADPWAFKSFLATVPLTSSYAQFNALLHLVHPDSFEPIVSRDHKEAIASAFANLAPNSGDDIDRRILAVRRALSERHGEGFSFYLPEVVEQWGAAPAIRPGAPEVQPAPDGNPISELFREFMNGWSDATRQPLKGHPIQSTMRQLRDALGEASNIDSAVFHVASSVGSGNWAQVPWIAFLHPQETTTTQRGIYPVYLFRADGSGVYLTLAQGVTEANQTLGRAKAREELQVRARRTQDLIEGALPSFDFETSVELRGATELANDYQSSVIAHRFYDAEDLPDDEELTADLHELVQAYAAFVEGRIRQTRSWIFQANPSVYRVSDAVEQLTELSWTVAQHRQEIAVGDEVFLWEAGTDAGIVAVARVTEAPQLGPQVPEHDPYLVVARGLEIRCLLRLEASFPRDRILRSELQRLEMQLPILLMSQGTNFPVPPEESSRLRDLAFSRVPMLIGATPEAEADAMELRSRVKALGRAANWWSFPLSDEMHQALARHPFVYFYQGLPKQALLARVRVLDARSQSGSSGIVCPWPEYAPAELRGRTTAGATKAEVFKTWLLVDGVERLEPALSVAELERNDGHPMNPSGLVGGFQLWHRRRSVVAPTLSDLALATHLTVPRLAELESIVTDHRQKQIVFEGPPGAGKTFVADKFARYLTGNPLEGQTDARVVTVQFHQSYGYEDFVQGIRPESDVTTGQIRYELRPGIFKELCDRAAADPGHKYVMVIDEINRGNISRILGELLLVLEYRDRQVQLAYSPPGATPFSVPDNVFILGTMNTTDRSLTQIDYALRRRFYFYRLNPVDGSTAPVLETWLKRQDIGADSRALVLRLFLSLNRKVQEELDEHFQVGHSYFMRPGIELEEVQEQVWRFALLPLLEEYFYNRPDVRQLLKDFSRAALLEKDLAVEP